MNFHNDSKHYVRAYIYSGFPWSEKNRAGSFIDYGPGTKASCQLEPGDYYISISTTNIGTLPPGLTIAASGGISSDGTVTLTESDRIAIT